MRRDPDERTPCGVAGGLTLACPRPLTKSYISDDLADCLVVRPKPFRLVIWEPLQTKAPSPPKARAWCCYLRTVIFYHSPHIPKLARHYWRDRQGRLRASYPAGFEQWDQIETRIADGDVLAFEAERFASGAGRVLWKRGRWWMVHHARRQEAAE